jgi:opacity protein-like surface antigen
MKKILLLSASAVLLGITFYCAIVDLIDTNHKYTVSYNHGGYPARDYTDTFQLSNNSVQYVDEHGDVINRYGTFSIEKNQDYKK